MIFAITGGTGFIGTRLVERHLAAGDRVRILTRRSGVGYPGCEVFRGDLADSNSELAPFLDGADVLYHCAGEIRDQGRMHALHVDGIRRLLKAARGKIGRWVQLSSVGAYGSHRAGAVTEATPVKPIGLYEETKAESDRLVAMEADGFAVCILRPSIVFAEDMTNRSLFQMISAIHRGLFFFIGQPGASANYIHVKNVIDALLLCATSPAAVGRTFNLSDWVTLESFVGTMAQALGKPAPRLRLPEAPVRMAARLLGRFRFFPLTESRVDALVTRTTYPSDCIARELGYTHGISMEEGLRGMVEAWRSRR